MTFKLGAREDAVCLALSSEKGILAVGSQENLTLIDSRLPGTIARVSNDLLDWGIWFFFIFFLRIVSC